MALILYSTWWRGSGCKAREHMTRHRGLHHTKDCTSTSLIEIMYSDPLRDSPVTLEQLYNIHSSRRPVYPIRGISPTVDPRDVSVIYNTVGHAHHCIYCDDVGDRPTYLHCFVYAPCRDMTAY